MPEGSILQRNLCFFPKKEKLLTHTSASCQATCFSETSLQYNRQQSPAATCPISLVLTGHLHSTASCSRCAKAEPELYLVGLQANDGGIHLDGDKDFWLVDNV